MFELTIKEKVYQFNFGFGFIRELDPKVKKEVEGVKGKVQDMGVQFAIAGLIDGDVNDLINVLDAANKSFEPRITRKELEEHIENEETDIDELFKNVMDFLESANCTKRTVAKVKELIEEQKAKQAAEI